MSQNRKCIIYIFNFFVFFTLAVGNTQLLPYLRYLGYPIEIRGMILASTAIVSIVGQILFGYLCDRFSHIRRFFYLSFLLLIFSGWMLFYEQSVFFLYHIITCAILGGMVKVVMGLHETWMFQLAKRSYGILRAYGAFGLGVGAVVSGYLITKFTFSILLVIFSIAFVIVSLLLCFIKDLEQMQIRKKVRPSPSLWKNKDYWILVFLYFLIYAAGTCDQFVVIEKLLLLQSGSALIGWKWALQAFMEIPFLFVSERLLRQFRCKTLLLFAIVMYILKFIFYAVARSPLQILMIAILQIVTMPIVTLTSKILIKKVSDANCFHRAQMFAMAVFSGGSMFLTPILASYLTKGIGVDATLYVVAVFFILPLVLTCFVVEAA